jgi:hypothetical protein
MVDLLMTNGGFTVGADISAVDGVVLALVYLLNGENVDFVGIPIGITHDIPTENTI